MIILPGFLVYKTRDIAAVHARTSFGEHCKEEKECEGLDSAIDTIKIPNLVTLSMTKF